MKKVGFVSLGCPKNLLDSEVMLGHLTRSGYQLVQNPEEAEVLVVNTCGFIEAAKQESIDTILEMAKHKTNGNCRRLVVTGCLAQRYAQDIARDIPEVDVVFGLDQLDTVVDACESGERRVENVRADGSAAYLYDHLAPRVLTTPSHYAYLKISEGCDYPCTFCIIPKIRGSYRSRDPESILAEAESLAAQGVKELVLIAQDTTRYGAELGLKHGLASVLRQLSKIEGIEWVRFLYAYPTTVDDQVLEALASEPKLCRYVDIPLQHASDPILKAMKRPGTGASNLALVRRIREAVDGVAVRSSFIVGFPGESKSDYEALLRFCAEAELDHLGVFTYSNEEGTGAFNLDNKIPRRIAVRRRNQLMKEQSKISAGKLRGMVGRTVRVLLEGRSGESDLLLQGRMQTQAPDIDGHVLINDAGDQEPAAGAFYNVEITESLEYDLIGRLA